MESENEMKIKNIRKTVSLIQEFVLLPEYVKMKKNNYENFYQHMISIFPVFHSKYPTLFEMVITGVDMKNLNKLLELHSKANETGLYGMKRSDYVGENFVKSFD